MPPRGAPTSKEKQQQQQQPSKNAGAQQKKEDPGASSQKGKDKPSQPSSQPPSSPTKAKAAPPPKAKGSPPPLPKAKPPAQPSLSRARSQRQQSLRRLNSNSSMHTREGAMASFLGNVAHTQHAPLDTVHEQEHAVAYSLPAREPSVYLWLLEGLEPSEENVHKAQVVYEVTTHCMRPAKP